MSTAAELGSASSTLDQVRDRIVAAARAIEGTANEDLVIGLNEVERQLKTASRRLERLVKELRDR